MNILIAVPTFENIYPDTFKSIWDLDKGGHSVAFDFVRGYDCASARNRIARKAIDGNYDFVLMVDNDVTLPESALVDMLEDAKDVCLGYYAHRNADNLYTGRVSVCRLKDEHGKAYFDYPLESEYTAEEMKRFRAEGKTKIQIHGGGMGCALINTDVFRRLTYPWYYWANRKNSMLSEDLFFCELCRKARIPIYTDARAGCGHLLRHIQMPE